MESKRDKKPKEKQLSFFDKDAHWKEHWQDMPEYSHTNLKPYKQIIVNFANKSAFEMFKILIEQPILLSSRSIWYPPDDIGLTKGKRYADES